jgi:carbamoyl-phosphate synthase small subunit
VKAILVLSDGTTISGRGFGALQNQPGELVFNTSMVGYQEALTDPSYAGQILIMSYPLIGNYGINKREFESDRIHVNGFVVRQASPDADHRESYESLDAFLKEHDVPGIEGIDTRFLIRKLRTQGVMPSFIATYKDSEAPDTKKLSDELAKFDYGSIDFVQKVTRKEPQIFGNARGRCVVLIDYGVKMGIVRELVQRGLRVAVVPSFATAEEIEGYSPVGIVLSNGPGDPAILSHTHAAIQKLAKKDYPIMGICLGHQLIAHAFGGKTYKLKFGHRGSNHPVLDKTTNKITITTQNHGYAVDERVPPDFEITHINLNDNTVEGMWHTKRPIFSVQYHPESCPGPRDSVYLFDNFVKVLG